MAAIEDRLAGFTSDRLPDDDAPVELLCRDHRGTYTIPFACHRAADVWRNSQTDEIIGADVVGWRPWERKIHA
ncbi:hypothetical protein [Methylocystis suflitae]|uniref:hypothetical protein n=1 Tax=Methylocystis suflitae TaxID=2951405 RepID=UPI0021097342|nr:hypothetical protein [Methylocystis suflitae]MCQ4188573.1 hypothetical protein [Methylocystis suflitae]